MNLTFMWEGLKVMRNLAFIHSGRFMSWEGLEVMRNLTFIQEGRFMLWEGLKVMRILLELDYFFIVC